MDDRGGLGAGLEGVDNDSITPTAVTSNLNAWTWTSGSVQSNGGNNGFDSRDKL